MADSAALPMAGKTALITGGTPGFPTGPASLPGLLPLERFDQLRT